MAGTPKRVHVRSMETREIVHSVECSHLYGTSNYERMILGLSRNMDLDRFYIDESEMRP